MNAPLAQSHSPVDTEQPPGKCKLKSRAVTRVRGESEGEGREKSEKGEEDKEDIGEA